MEITQFLVAAMSADARVRTGAEASLRQFQDQDLPLFLLSLSFELANDAKPLESRRLAGILLINSLDARNASTKDYLVQQWTAIDTLIRSQIKDLLLTTLASSSFEARHTSAQVIAKLASIEIPLKQWPHLVKSLFSNMSDQATPATLKQSTLETLGYLCEEIYHDDLEEDEVEHVLQAIVYGSETSSQVVHLVAAKALLHALDIAQTNFDNQVHRTVIMNMVFETAMSHEAEIRHAAFECLVSIASIYYEVVCSYISRICQLTLDAIIGDEESIALQAVEFWSSICDVEIELPEFVDPDSNDWSRPRPDLIKWALPHLVPVLLETFLKQDQGNDAWNLSMAAETCLGLVATTVGADIVPFVTAFVQTKISEPHWRSREGTTHALGSVLERFL